MDLIQIKRNREEAKKHVKTLTEKELDFLLEQTYILAYETKQELNRRGVCLYDY